MVSDTNVNRELGAFSDVDATDAADFIDRLDKMQQFSGFAKYKRQSFEAMALGSGSVVADIGCGPGDDANGLSQIVGANGHVTGIDISTAMVAEAGKRFAGSENLVFAVASADALPFENGSLDAIRADRVLIHVPDPKAALQEMLRVLRPGGRLVISEPDMCGFWVSSDNPQATAPIVAAIAGSCAHPYFPRDMSVMLRDLGLVDIADIPFAMVSGDFEMVNQVLRFELVAKAVVEKGLAPAGPIECWVAEQVKRRADGRFCAGLNVLTVAATKGDSVFSQLSK
jgi:SAM-dependent methyltransferase